MNPVQQRQTFTAEKRLGGQINGMGDPESVNAAFDAALHAKETAGAAAAADPEMKADIKQLIGEVTKLRKQLSGESDLESTEDIRIEIAQMVRMIGRAKQEIAAIKHPRSDDDRVSAASSELDAIVLATETATQDILDANEKIEQLIKEIGGLTGDDEIIHRCEQAGEYLVNILEACNFQDITGQRITKVIRTLRFIEERILAMINIWGVQAFADLPVPKGEFDAESEEALLNGPQLENQGISQADIDALFD